MPMFIGSPHTRLVLLLPLRYATSHQNIIGHTEAQNKQGNTVNVYSGFRTVVELCWLAYSRPNYRFDMFSQGVSFIVIYRPGTNIKHSGKFYFRGQLVTTCHKVMVLL